MNKTYRIFILAFALMVLLTHFVKFELFFSFLLPSGFHDYPRPHTIGDFEYIVFKILLSWIMPFLCGVLFVVFAGLADKIVNKKGVCFSTNYRHYLDIKNSYFICNNFC